MNSSAVETFWTKETVSASLFEPANIEISSLKTFQVIFPLSIAPSARTMMGTREQTGVSSPTHPLLKCFIPQQNFTKPGEKRESTSRGNRRG